MAWPLIALAAIGGAVAGEKKDQATRKTEVTVGSNTELGRRSARTLRQQLEELNQLTRLGPGAEDVKAGLTAQRGLAETLGQYAKSGGLPTQADMSLSRDYVRQLMRPQELALNLGQERAFEQANRLAAQLGTSPNDPLVQRQLAQSTQEQFLRLAADRQANTFGFARDLVGQRLNYQTQQAQQLTALADQATSNRYRLSALGAQLLAGERGFRAMQTTTNELIQSGGGPKGMIAGALQGASMAQGMSGGGGMGGAGGQQGGLNPGPAPNFGGPVANNQQPAVTATSSQMYTGSQGPYNYSTAMSQSNNAAYGQSQPSSLQGFSSRFMNNPGVRY